ncbi:MAG: hypothetical protein IJV43_08790, partial [Oscillospiraceae bacterium]|nr:hypothetical protein [Oscillospiraceae bacterium]
MSLSQMTFSGAILIAGIALLRLLLRQFLPKRTFLMLWAVVLARLLIPFAPMFAVPVPMPEALAAPVEQASPAVSDGDIRRALDALTSDAARPERESAAVAETPQRAADA